MGLGDVVGGSVGRDGLSQPIAAEQTRPAPHPRQQRQKPFPVQRHMPRNLSAPPFSGRGLCGGRGRRNDRCARVAHRLARIKTLRHGCCTPPVKPMQPVPGRAATVARRTRSVPFPEHGTTEAKGDAVGCAHVAYRNYTHARVRRCGSIPLRREEPEVRRVT